ncbi:MAG: hypothetical protein RIS76_1679 [Verrucomicrobiota bacterium]|jgi:hypothetical protein
MIPRISRGASLVTALSTLLLAFIFAAPPTAQAAGRNSSTASGGGGGGGSVKAPKVAESRVTGYITAIDSVNHTLVVGASYYGSGSLRVDSSTQVSLNNLNGSFADLKQGDWCEARYDWTTKLATKLSVTRP